MLVRISARQSVLCRLPGSSCTDAAQPLGWPHTERQSSADSSMYRRVEYCKTVKLWILSSMTPRRGIAGPVEVLSWQPQLPVKCRLEIDTTHLRDAFPPLPGIPSSAPHTTPATQPPSSQTTPTPSPHLPEMLCVEKVGRAGLPIHLMPSPAREGPLLLRG